VSGRFVGNAPKNVALHHAEPRHGGCIDPDAADNAGGNTLRVRFHSAETQLMHTGNSSNGHINRCLLSIFRKRLPTQGADPRHAQMKRLITDEAFRKFDSRQEIVASILLIETKRFHTLPVAQTFA
jgi:hypothetical protein